MKLPRFRFSLRTLLLATLLVGIGMLVWHVREPWALRRWPLVQHQNVKSRDDSMDVLFPELSPKFHLSFSPSGNFLLFNRNDLALENDKDNAVLDLRDGYIALRCPTNEQRWHPHDDILLVDQKKLIRFPDAKTIFESTGWMTFSNTGKYLIEQNSGQVSYREMNRFKPAFVIEARGDSAFGEELLLLNDRHLVRANKHADPAKPDSAQYQIECFDIPSARSLWTWAVPADCQSCQLSVAFRWHNGTFSQSDGTFFFVTCILSDKSTWEYGRPSRQTIYTMDIASGKPRNIGIDVIYSTVCQLVRFDEYSDGEWHLTCNKGLSTLICDSTKNNRKLFELTAFNARIGMPISVSENKQRIVACIDNNALGIWTRRRQHFEWWGMYEQPETWLAAVFVMGFVWSVWRDWKETRR